MVSIGGESLQRNRVDGFRPDEGLHVFQVAVSGILGAGAGPQETLNPRTLILEFVEAFSASEIDVASFTSILCLRNLCNLLKRS